MRHRRLAILAAACAALTGCSLEGDPGSDSRSAVVIARDAAIPIELDGGGSPPDGGGPPRDAAPPDGSPGGPDGGGHDAGEGDAGAGEGDAGAGAGDAGAGDDGGPGGPPDAGIPEDFQPSCVDTRHEDQDGVQDGHVCDDYDTSSFCVMTSGCPSYCVVCTDGTSACYPCSE